MEFPEVCAVGPELKLCHYHFLDFASAITANSYINASADHSSSSAAAGMVGSRRPLGGLVYHIFKILCTEGMSNTDSLPPSNDYCLK